MKKSTKLFVTAFAIILLACAAVIVMVTLRNKKTYLTEDEKGTIEALSRDVFIGDFKIEEYVIVNRLGSAGNESAKTLSKYIYKLSGKELPVVRSVPGSGKYISIEKAAGKRGETSANSGSDTAKIAIHEGNIKISLGYGEKGLDAVNIFANGYLGFAFAGEEREFITLDEGETLYLPDEELEVEKAWIAEREPIICLWKTTTARGAYCKEDTNPLSEIMSYSDSDLYTYVRMMKRLGYTGIQVTDMCSAWAGYGSYEYIHERLRFMADAAHSMGMKFTLWVWGAEFNGYSWSDKSVDYYDHWKYVHAYENPKALATFEKYYDIYAEMADCSDRVIMHFDDPGKLINNEDIAFFARMLREKFRAINPDIDFGVSCYLGNRDILELDGLMEGDTTYYSGARVTEEQKWDTFRTVCRTEGFEYGVWSWNLTEMEIDQLAEMNVNAAVIKNVYRMSAEEDDLLVPSYWSEMDSYHVLNVFSHYVAAALLRNPELDEQELLKESAKAVVGDEYADKLYYVLKLIEDARSGKNMKEFRNRYDEYLLLSDVYPAEDVFERSKIALSYMDEMIEADIKCATLPLPATAMELLEAMKPHVVQINEYSSFRVSLNELKEKADSLDKEQLQKEVNNIYTPVGEYDVIVGLWGQPEARAQFMLLSDFCKEYDLEIPRDEEFTQLRKDRVLSEYIDFQKKSSEIVYRSKTTGFQVGAAFGEEETAYITQLLIDEGLLSENEEGLVYLTDWEKY